MFHLAKIGTIVYKYRYFYVNRRIFIVKKLKAKILQEFKRQGFSINGIIAPKNILKTTLKALHKFSTIEQIKLQKEFLLDNVNVAKKYIIDGKDIDPSKINLELREINNDCEDSILYRWWNLSWWSVPYQRAYGRQLRFLLWDKMHNAPFGIIGLQSPILKMSVRDNFLKIPAEELDIWVNKSMQAQRLGALPPYNLILGGKMVALAMTSNGLRDIYKMKYTGKKTLLEKRVLDSDLLFITTTSAYGKSSIYNRLKYKNEKVAISLGFTKGTGTFHIPQELYLEIKSFLQENGEDVNTSFGYGPSRKIKNLNKAFSMLQLNNFTQHNIKREFFIFPFAHNLQQVISMNEKPIFVDRDLKELTEFWKHRWSIPRSIKYNDWSSFVGKNIINSMVRKIHGKT